MSHALSKPYRAVFISVLICNITKDIGQYLIGYQTASEVFILVRLLVHFLKIKFMHVLRVSHSLYENNHFLPGFQLT